MDALSLSLNEVRSDISSHYMTPLDRLIEVPQTTGLPHSSLSVYSFDGFIVDLSKWVCSITLKIYDRFQCLFTHTNKPSSLHFRQALQGSCLLQHVEYKGRAGRIATYVGN